MCGTTSSLSLQTNSTVECLTSSSLDFLSTRLALTYVLQILFTACAGIREHAVSILAIDEVVRSLQGDGRRYGVDGKNSYFD